MPRGLDKKTMIVGCGYIWNKLQLTNSSCLGILPEKEQHLTGVYDLVAVLTHKGRSADSGHYVAWVKQENGQFLFLKKS